MRTSLSCFVGFSFTHIFVFAISFVRTIDLFDVVCKVPMIRRLAELHQEFIEQSVVAESYGTA